MQRLEVSGAVRLIYRSLGVKGLSYTYIPCLVSSSADKHKNPNEIREKTEAFTVKKKELLQQ